VGPSCRCAHDDELGHTGGEGSGPRQVRMGLDAGFPYSFFFIFLFIFSFLFFFLFIFKFLFEFKFKVHRHECHKIPYFKYQTTVSWIMLLLSKLISSSISLVIYLWGNKWVHKHFFLLIFYPIFSFVL
jgi:hypothetical protein